MRSSWAERVQLLAASESVSKSGDLTAARPAPSPRPDGPGPLWPETARADRNAHRKWFRDNIAKLENV